MKRVQKKTEDAIEFLTFMAAHTGIEAPNFVSFKPDVLYKEGKKSINKYLDLMSFDMLNDEDSLKQPLSIQHPNVIDGVNVELCGKTRTMLLARFNGLDKIYIDKKPIYLNIKHCLVTAMWECFKPEDLTPILTAAIYDGYFTS